MPPQEKGSEIEEGKGKSCHRSRGKGKFGKRLRMFEGEVLEIRPSWPPIGMMDIVGEDLKAAAKLRVKLKRRRVRWS